MKEGPASNGRSQPLGAAHRALPASLWSAALVVLPGEARGLSHDPEPQEAAPGQAEPPAIWRTGLACGVNAAYALGLLESAEPLEYSDFQAAIPVGERGASLAAVAEGLRACGIPCEVVRATPKDLVPSRLPILVHFDQVSGNVAVGHYCILVDYDEALDTATVIDGANGLQYDMNIDPFRRMWSGYAVVPTRGADPWARIELLLGVATLILAGLLARTRLKTRS